MTILYFYQYFSTSNGSWGTRVHEFTREWAKNGHEVIVVTSIYSKSDLKSDKLFETQIIDNVKVKILNLKVDNKQSFLRRVFGFLIYSFVASWYAVSIRADVVIASSGPITVGIPGLIAKLLRKRKLIFEVRDLWPDGAIELGLLKNKILKYMAFRLERLCYKNSDLIVALSPGMKEEIEKKSQGSKVISVTNSANIELFASRQNFPEHKMFFQPKTYALYTGNIGMVNNATWMFEAAKLLKEMNRSDIKIVWIGDGQQKSHFLKRKLDEQVDNLIIIDLMPKKELVPIVQHALVCLAPLKESAVLNTSSPNKFFESLAAGVPVIQTTNGWMKDFLYQHEVGFTLNPNNPQELADFLINIEQDVAKLDKMRSNASSIAKRYFDKDVLSKYMLNEIVNA